MSNILSRGFFLLLLAAVPNCGMLGQNKTPNEGAVYYLDSKQLSITQPIDTAANDVENAKFVQVEIVSVQNPSKRSLMFEVHYQPTGNQKIFLGTFSLYPSDNPGTFIVPTQGKLKRMGSLILSMMVGANGRSDDSNTLKVGVKKLQLKQQ